MSTSTSRAACPACSSYKSLFNDTLRSSSCIQTNASFLPPSSGSSKTVLCFTVKKTSPIPYELLLMDLTYRSVETTTDLSGSTCLPILQLHVKPMYGGTVTDLQFWLYYPFNGAAMLKVGPLDIKLGKIGEHVSDWEHLTIRIDNLTGSLSRIYLGHHSGGTWYQPSDMEFDKNTGRPLVYASKHGHACYGHPGAHLQGNDRIGILNDTKPSSFTWDLSNNYQLISADYLGVEEPPWLQFMREWGPKLQYNTKKELEKVFKLLPKKVRRSIEDLLSKFPNELSGQEGPTGPKQKNFWTGEER